MTSNKQVVLCISDSLGMPRDGVDYRETWVSKLKSMTNDFDFVPLFRRAQTTKCLNESKEYLLWYNPSSVIIQLGICDCSPRYLVDTSLLYRIVVHLPHKIESLFWRIYKKTHKRTLKKVNVQPEQYRANFEKYLELCRANGVDRVVIIKIAQPAQAMFDDNPLVESAITSYNIILEDTVAKYSPLAILLDPLNQGHPQNYIEDGYHTNSRGNQLVAQSIINQFENGSI